MPVKLLSVKVAPAMYGQGVFACRKFKKREKVGRIHGVVICDARHGSEYAIDLGEGRLLEPAAPFRFLNHSCEPNCELLNYTPDEPQRDEHDIVVRTLRAIEPGEQLTIDYAWSADAAIPCGCAATRCRGWIVSADQLPRLLDRHA